MSTFSFHSPKKLNNSIFGGSIGNTENFRAKNLLILNGLGGISKGNSVSKRLKYEFIKIPYSLASKPKIDTIVSKIDASNKSEVARFLDNAKIKNLIFHKKIHKELVNAIGYLEEGNNISCFLHLYRIIEQSALCLPVITVLKKGNLENTFSEFKKLIEGGAKTDLSVLKKYSENQPTNSPLDTNVTLSFSGTTKPQQNVNVVKKFIKTPVTSSNQTIEIKYKQIDSLIIGFRNQFFHFLFHENNLCLDEIEFPEEFLEVCNPIFINYFSFLFKDLIDSEKTLWG